MANIPAPSLTVDRVLDERPLSRFQIVTIGLCVLVLLLDGFDTQSMGFLVPPISEELGIPLTAFGPVLSAALVGLMIGAMVAGPIADRFGRRLGVIGSVFVFGAFSLWTTQADSLNEFVILRFLTGLGLGGAMPNVVALVSEYSPRRLQPVLVPLIFVGMGGGAVVASLVASVMIPVWGWRSVFYVGGTLPIVLGLALLKTLPESVRFLSASGVDANRRGEALGILKRIAPDVAEHEVALSAESTRATPPPVAALFTEGRGAGTLLLWIPFFMNLLILYFVLSWLPALLRQAGMPVSAGINAVLVFSIGGIVGTIVQGRLMKVATVHGALLLEFVVSLGLVCVAYVSFESFPVMMLVTFFLGVAVQGAQAGLNAAAAMYYPTVIRSTGIGWALGVGRVGSIAGPMLGGLMLSMSWTPQQIFLAGSIPACSAALAVFASHQLQGARSPYTSSATRANA